MDVIERVEQGEWPNREQLAELLRLARLGRAAEKGFMQDGNFPCGKEYGGVNCTGTYEAFMCGWADFCRERSGNK